jgi:hypothetical protein
MKRERKKEIRYLHAAVASRSGRIRLEMKKKKKRKDERKSKGIIEILPLLILRRSCFAKWLKKQLQLPKQICSITEVITEAILAGAGTLQTGPN